MIPHGLNMATDWQDNHKKTYLIIWQYQIRLYKWIVHIMWSKVETQVLFGIETSSYKCLNPVLPRAYCLLNPQLDVLMVAFALM